MRILAPALALSLLLPACEGGPTEPHLDPVISDTHAVDLPDDFVAARDIWWVSADDGDRGVGWRDPDYKTWEDPTWARVGGPMGYGEDYIDPESTLPYGADAAHKPPTVYADHYFTIDDPALVDSLLLDVMYDDGFVAYVNGHEVARAGLPAGPVAYGTLAAGHEANATYHTFDLAAARSFLLPGNNLLAIEIHQVSAASSDLVFDARLSGLVDAVPPGPEPVESRGVPYHAVWKYWDGGGDLGTAWRRRGFDDSEWRFGPARLGYGEDYLGTVVRYGDDPAHKHITTYFRRDFIVEHPEVLTAADVLLDVDDGAVVYLNGREVGRLHIPDGPVHADTLALPHESQAYEAIDLMPSKRFFVDGVNTIAIEVHQASPSSSDLVFDPAVRLFKWPPNESPDPVDRGARWRYRDDGADLGSAWQTAAYDDSAWARGAAPLGFGDPGLATRTRRGPITTYFRKSFEVDLPAGWEVTDLVGELRYDDGMVIYLNGHELGRAHMPAGPITASTLASDHEASDPYERYDWSWARSYIVAGRNVLAVEVHQASADSDDLSFDLSLDVDAAPRFHRYAGNPVTPIDDPGPSGWWRSTEVTPQVVRVDDGSYRLYYMGTAGFQWNIARGVSPDGLAFTLDPQRLESLGDAAQPDVLYENGEYRMWYVRELEPGIWLARSTDGVTFTPVGNAPVVREGTRPQVIHEGGSYRMWFEDADGLRVATSSDGVAWDVRPAPVFAAVRTPSIAKVDGGYFMFFDEWTMDGGGIRVATSSDGVHWTRRGRALDFGQAEGWDYRVQNASVRVEADGTLRMYYVGVGAAGNARIGLATFP